MLISVIVPCYNHAPYLKERLDSIFNQTYQNFEVILLDDLSPDNSAEILLSYKDHPKVSHCIINTQNSGSTFHQWNKGIDLAAGEYIWIAESDDVADVNFLAVLIEQFRLNDRLVLAYAQSYRMNAEGEVTGTWKDYTDSLDDVQFSHHFVMNGIDYTQHFLIHKNTVPNASAVLFRKQTYLDVGGPTPDFKLIGDWEIWIKIILEGDIYFHADCLNYFRYHKTSVIARAQQEQGQLQIASQVISFHISILNYLDKMNVKPAMICEYEKQLYKHVSRSASYAIRKRLYPYIIPTTKAMLTLTPSYLLPYVIFKFTIKFIYAITIDAMLSKLLSFRNKKVRLI